MEKFKNFLFINSSVGQILVKNTFWLFFGEVTSRLLRLVLVVYAARVLGEAGWGLFSYALNIIGLIYIFSDLGLDSVVTREIVKTSREKLSYFATAFVIRAALSALAIFLVLLIPAFYSQFPEVSTIIFPIALMLALESLRNLILAIGRALEKMEKEAFIRGFSSFATVALGLLVLAHNPSIQNLAYAYLTGSIIGLVLSILVFFDYFVTIPKYFSGALIRPIFKISWPFFVFWVTGSIMVYTDILMIGFWQPAEELGHYAAAQRLIQFILVIPSLVALAVLPVFSKFISESKERLRDVLESTLSFVFLLGLPIVAGGLILAENIVLTSFGGAYLESTLVFQIFLIMLLGAFPAAVLNNFIFAHNLQRKFIWPSVVGAILNILLNWIFIPKWGIAGAAMATMLATMVQSAAIWVMSKNILSYRLSLKKIILATMFMSLVTFWGDYVNLNLWANIILSGVIFVLALLLLKEPTIKKIWQVI